MPHNKTLLLLRRVNKQASELEALKQTNQIIQSEMTKVTQRNNTLGKEKSQLDVKIEALSNEKQKLVVKSLFLFKKN